MGRIFSAAQDDMAGYVFFANRRSWGSIFFWMIRKLPSGEYRLYSRKKDAKSGKRKNLGTFASRAAAQKHERAVHYFKRA
ncbi:MAG: hypothetical protein WB562_15585 [Candidatus Sulfotelmatobacter sp.]